MDAETLVAKWRVGPKDDNQWPQPIPEQRLENERMSRLLGQIQQLIELTPDDADTTNE